MKVLQLVGGLPTKEKPFMQPFIKSQIDSLIKKGIDIEILDIKGYESPLNYFKSIFGLRKIVRTKKIDLIHAHYNYCALSAVLSAVDKPIVFSVMGGELLGSPDFDGRYKSRGKIDKFLSTYVANKTEHIIVKSEQLKMILKVDKPVSVIPNGVDFLAFKPCDIIAAREKLGYSQEKFIILFLGNPRDPIKNFKLAEESVSLLKKKKNINCIEFITPYGIEHSRIAGYMNAADVLLVTSFYEGSPNVVKEAMACNLPVVSTDVGDVKEIIKGTADCFICGGKEEISEKLEIIYNSRARTNGREKIGHLRDDMIAEKIILIYESVLNRKSLLVEKVRKE